MAVGAGKYWFNGLPVDGLSSTAGAGKYWFNGVPYDTLAAAAAPSGVTGTVNLTQAGNTLSAAATVPVQVSASVTQAGDTTSTSVTVLVQGSGTLSQEGDSPLSAAVVTVKGIASGSQAGDVFNGAAAVVISGQVSVSVGGDSVLSAGAVRVSSSASNTQDDQTVAATGGSGVYPVADLVQDGQSVLATAISQAKATLEITQANNTAPPVEPFVVAPSYGTWAKRQNKSKPQAPQLPPPVEAGEIVIDEAVLRQMEEERLAALALKKKTEALDRVEELRAYAPTEKRPTRSFTIDPRRFDVVEAAPEIRTKVVSLFREQPKPALVEPVRGSITLRALGPRHLPEPEIRKARTISLRRSPNRMMQTGL